MARQARRDLCGLSRAMCFAFAFFKIIAKERPRSRENLIPGGATLTSMSAPPSEWDRLGNVHYHRRHLYSFSDVRVDGRNCVAAVNGGAFAVRSTAAARAVSAAASADCGASDSSVHRGPPPSSLPTRQLSRSGCP